MRVSFALMAVYGLATLNVAFGDDAGNADILPDQVCMQEAFGAGLTCTANDIQLAAVTDIQDDGCDFPGDTVTFTGTFVIKLTAQARYDIGLWIATDGDPNGDGALTGDCTVFTPAYGPEPPFTDLDGDTCGDIDDNPNPIEQKGISLTVVCTDEDGDGFLDLPYCSSWRQPGANDVCTSPVQAFPGAPSKCFCERFNIEIPVPTPSPTTSPTVSPTASPTVSPTDSPTTSPTSSPTQNPTASPTASPTGEPTGSPTSSPTGSPTEPPTVSPTVSPTGAPTGSPTSSPTASPTERPTVSPTVSPTGEPTGSPTSSPTGSPTERPTVSPTVSPTGAPTGSPTSSPTASPTERPTVSPTVSPTGAPTVSPTESPTEPPTGSPTVSPTDSPTSSPTKSPTQAPAPVECETAFAKGRDGSATCFLDLSDPPKANRWGWTNFYNVGNLPVTLDIYAAAGQCDVDKGTLVGTVTLTLENGGIRLTYEAFQDYFFKTAHFYVGTEPLPKTKNGEYTVAPGQYPVVLDPLNAVSGSEIFSIDGTDFYVIAHFDVCSSALYEPEDGYDQAAHENGLRGRD